MERVSRKQGSHVHKLVTYEPASSLGPICIILYGLQFQFGIVSLIFHAPAVQFAMDRKYVELAWLVALEVLLKVGLEN